jgi:streptogramin lyase
MAKTQNIFYIAALLVIFSCNPIREKSTLSSATGVVKAIGYDVPKDSMADPKIIPVGKPTVVRIGKPVVVPTKSNVHAIGTPTVILAGSPKVCTPGKDTFSSPKIISAIENPVMAGIPEVILAKDAFTKDQNLENFSSFGKQQGLNSAIINCLLEDNNGNLWIGTYEGGVTKYDGKTFTHFMTEQGLSFNSVRNMFQDKRGNLWFCTTGVDRYDGQSITHFTEKEGLSSNWTTSIMEDEKGHLWFGTNGGGVNEYDGKNFTHFSVREGLPHNNVTCIMKDKNGNLWFGTQGGVSKYDGKNFTNFTEKEGLSDNAVFDILEDKNGNIWFGTKPGVSKYDGKSFTNFTIEQGFHYVWNILKDKRGNLWFGSFWGIGVYDGKTFTRFAEQEIDVKCMLEDKRGNLWFGTHTGGVAKYDNKTFTYFTEKEGLSHNRVRGIAEDENGNLLFATLNGLSIYNAAEGRQRFTNFTRKADLGDTQLVSILKDKVGHIWIGTFGGGLLRYDGNSFIRFTEKEGLSNTNVRNIIEDKNGNLWFGTAFGLNKLEKHKLSSLTESAAIERESLFKTYTYEDGFSGMSVNWGKTLYEAKDGTIWIATEDRLTAYHPNEDFPDTISPNIQLTGLSLFNENIAWQNFESKDDSSIVLGNGVKFHNYHFDSVSKWYGIPRNLSLAYDNNFLTFHFVGVTVSSPKKVRYKFKLEGLDRNWSSVTNRNEANYGNLLHGKYTFKVKAMNGDGYWSNELAYSFIIRPPWWQTWWAYTLFAVLATGVIYSIFRYRLNKLRIQHQLSVQEHKVTELEMQTLRSQMNPHFIFNSLNSINLFILENDKLQASEFLSKFSKLVRMILNNSREAFIPLEQELEALDLYLQLEALRFEQKFYYKIEVDSNIDTSILKVPPLIIQPFAENAIWHGLMNKKDKGNLTISLRQNKNYLLCKIADDGVGRKKAAELKSKSSTRRSVGMHITAERIAMLQEEGEGNNYITVTDVVLPDGSPGGTEVLITIPTSQ